jgi:hypothetical protein
VSSVYGKEPYVAHGLEDVRSRDLIGRSPIEDNRRHIDTRTDKVLLHDRSVALT